MIDHKEINISSLNKFSEKCFVNEILREEEKMQKLCFFIKVETSPDLLCGSIDEAMKEKCVDLVQNLCGSIDDNCGSIGNLCGSIGNLCGSTVCGSIDDLCGSIDDNCGSIGKLCGSIGNLCGSIGNLCGSTVCGSIDDLCGSRLFY